jgi:subtilisin family serine protease
MIKHITFALTAGALAASAWGTTALPKNKRVSPIEPGAFIVTLKDGTAGDAAAMAQQVLSLTGGRVTHVYRHAFKGFAVRIPAGAEALLRAHPMVKAVEPDRRMFIQQQANAPVTQPNAPYGLNRVDQRTIVDGPGDYVYSLTGKGVRAYIVDTGVRPDHNDFKDAMGVTRVRGGAGFVPDQLGTMDCQGHGSHVAGTVGGKTYGVAKEVDITPVRVLGCDGSGLNSWIVAGMDWVVGDHLQRVQAAGGAPVPAVANMSLGGGASDASDQAAAKMVEAGIVLVVAAGNDSEDACMHSPARERKAITVGATEVTDKRADYSNFGPCVDIYAPGSNVRSVAAGTILVQNLPFDVLDGSNPISPDAYTAISGTSMASPHVAGYAALIKQRYPGFSPLEVERVMLANATTNAITTLDGKPVADDGSANRFMFTATDNLTAEATPMAASVRKVAVRSISARITGSASEWVANITVSIKDVGTSGNLDNLLVKGYFGDGTSALCKTNAAGVCSVNATQTAAVSTFSVASIHEPVSGDMSVVTSVPKVLHESSRDAAGGVIQLRAPR